MIEGSLQNKRQFVILNANNIYSGDAFAFTSVKKAKIITKNHI